MTRHELKTWPEHFSDIIAGRKSFEIRYDDRRFSVGDELDLREFDPTKDTYTGRHLVVRVVLLVRGGQFGIFPDHVVMSIREVS